MNAKVFVRSQHAKTGRSGFHGPDTYVAVAISDDALPSLPGRAVLHRARLAARGYYIYVVGEGYARHSGPRSYLGIALADADDIARRVRGWTASQEATFRAAIEDGATVKLAFRAADDAARAAAAADAARAAADDAARAADKEEGGA